MDSSMIRIVCAGLAVVFGIVLFMRRRSRSQAE
jgi:hypothetical protein